jgi:phage replication-related protein YjqB (UPF0714/DUF867 family)
MPSSYRNFGELSKREIEGKDYRRRYIPRPGYILVMAIHGGKIEAGTSEIAESISLDDFSLYCFEGLKLNGNNSLRIESHLFDEPRALKAITKADIIISIHGHCNNNSIFIMLGGRNTILGKAIKNKLENLGYAFRPCSRALGGKDPNNICNRGRKNAGVQLEISRKLRESLIKNKARLNEFAQAIREAIQTYIPAGAALSLDDLPPMS